MCVDLRVRIIFVCLCGCGGGGTGRLTLVLNYYDIFFMDLEAALTIVPSQQDTSVTGLFITFDLSPFLICCGFVQSIASCMLPILHGPSKKLRRTCGNDRIHVFQTDISPLLKQPLGYFLQSLSTITSSEQKYSPQKESMYELLSSSKAAQIYFIHYSVLLHIRQIN
jgi:hypothetical protein